MAPGTGFWKRPTSRTYAYNLDLGEHYYHPMTTYLVSEPALDANVNVQKKKKFETSISTRRPQHGPPTSKKYFLPASEMHYCILPLYSLAFPLFFFFLWMRPAAPPD